MPFPSFVDVRVSVKLFALLTLERSTIVHINVNMGLSVCMCGALSIFYHGVGIH